MNFPLNILDRRFDFYFYTFFYPTAAFEINPTRCRQCAGSSNPVTAVGCTNSQKEATHIHTRLIYNNLTHTYTHMLASTPVSWPPFKPFVSSVRDRIKMSKPSRPYWIKYMTRKLTSILYELLWISRVFTGSPFFATGNCFCLLMSCAVLRQYVNSL